ncbi:MAG: hypothetical protein ACFHWX_22970 [Bacteroidota bacterium]
MNYTELAIDVIGWLGAACYLIPYFLLISKKIRSTSAIYHVLNILGSFFLIINTFYYGATPSAFTNSIWGGIAIYGMISDRKRAIDSIPR